MMIMNDNDGWLMIIMLLDCDYHSPFAQMVLGCSGPVFFLKEPRNLGPKTMDNSLDSWAIL